MIEGDKVDIKTQCYASFESPIKNTHKNPGCMLFGESSLFQLTFFMFIFYVLMCLICTK